MFIPSPDYLRECFEYKEGWLYWRSRPDSHFSCRWSFLVWNKRFAGKRAGNIHKDGLWHVSVDNTTYKLHRVLWAVVTGSWPEMIVDHINGDRGDNRIENLRMATNQENSMSRHRAQKRNSCGQRGVTQDKRTGKYVAKIAPNGKSVHLGVFDRLADAVAARVSAEIKYFGAFAGTR